MGCHTVGLTCLASWLHLYLLQPPSVRPFRWRLVFVLSALQEQATSLMLKCNIDSTVNHLHDGILLGLKVRGALHHLVGCTMY
jgi:hypothetical protein